jgi:DNA polymerase delta subunit 3
MAVKKEDTTGLKRKGSDSEANTSGRSTPQPGPAASLKRSDSKSNLKKEKNVGDLFKSFAKAKPKAKGADKSTESTPAPTEDEQMQGMSEDEGDEDDAPEVKVDAEKTAKQDREEKLRQMMEADGNS